jgi:GntR family transcriptional regulator, transcriptional repressor for pyruvate dehydrogenase complex
LAALFGVSRVAVREATKALSFLGVIQAAPRRGLSVGNVDMSRVTQYLGFHFALADYPKEELLRTRMVIEVGAFPYVARAMSDNPAIVERLDKLIVATDEAKNLRARIEADITFHRALLEANGIGPLLAFDDLLKIFFDCFKRFLSHARGEVIVAQHRGLIRYLREGDVENARRLLADHLSIYPG